MCLEQAIEVGGAGAGASACRPTTSAAPTRLSRPSRSPCSREIDRCPTQRFSPGRSSSHGIARWPHRWTRGPTENLAGIDHHDVDAACREIVARLGRDGWLEHSAPDPRDASAQLDVRTLALIRETLARHEGLADFAFAMQGLGAGPISFFGTPEQRATWLTRTRRGDAITAFALTEPASGSDVAAHHYQRAPRRQRLRARRREDVDLERRHRRRLCRVRAHR